LEEPASVKILQACTGYPPDREGGVENVVRTLTEGLRNRENQVYVLTRLWKRRLNDSSVIQVRTPRSEAGGYLVWAVRSIGTIRKLRPDIVHCHGLEGAILCILLRPLRVKTIFHLHNSLSREPGYYGKLSHRVGIWILKRACSAAGVVVCPTQAVKEDLVSHLPSFDEKRAFVVPNMVGELSRWSPARLAALKTSLGLSGKRVILYFGKVKRSKGIEDLCQAYQMMKDRTGVALVIGGSPTWTENFASRLKQEYPDVIFTGFVEEAAPYYQMADLFCIYTDSFEGGETFAISLAEAMSFGVPVVCSDNPIFREVTRNEGFFVEPKSPRELSAMIEMVLKDRDLAARRAANAKRIADERYSSEGVVSRMEELYRMVLGQRRPRDSGQ
jgi:glycosyltransferase involved in cell wall biosynthesis